MPEQHEHRSRGSGCRSSSSSSSERRSSYSTGLACSGTSPPPIPSPLYQIRSLHEEVSECVTRYSSGALELPEAQLPCTGR